MNVQLLVHGLDIGGAEAMIAALARHLRGAGDSVEVGCLGALGVIAEELRADGIPVVLYERRPGFDRTLPLRLASHIRASGVEVVHLHQRTALFYGMLAGLLHTVPLVYTEHGPPFDPPPSAKQRLFNRCLAGRLARLTAVSRHTADTLRSQEGFVGREIELVPNGAAVGHSSGVEGGRAAARAVLNLADDAIVLVHVGRLVPVKNQQLLVRVAARLRQSDPRIQLLLIGDGPGRDRLEALAAEVDSADAVRFIGSRRDVADLLPAADVFCLSSVTEGIPVSVLESMAARVPVVCTASGGVPELLRPEVDGVLIDAQSTDVESYAREVRRVLDDASLRQRLVENAFMRVRDGFELDAVCRRYRKVLAAARDGSQ